jgi:hypothetical protein
MGGKIAGPVAKRNGGSLTWLTNATPRAHQVDNLPTLKTRKLRSAGQEIRSASWKNLHVHRMKRRRTMRQWLAGQEKHGPTLQLPASPRMTRQMARNARKRIAEVQRDKGKGTRTQGGFGMAKYGKSASKNVESTMRRKKKGTLKSSSGRKVRSRKQAIAIGLNEARRKGAKVPPRKRSRKGSAKKK